MQVISQLIAEVDEQTKKEGKNAEERYFRSYPFHPDLTDVFYSKWTNLEGFQRTRGVLRTLMLALRDAEKWDTAPLVTANVFLAEQGKDALPVDTHVFYISKKLGWAKSEHPHKVEEELRQLFPKKYWNKINSILVRFGKTHTSRKQKDELLDKIKKIR